jgi:hypothetical protein
MHIRFNSKGNEHEDDKPTATRMVRTLSDREGDRSSEGGQPLGQARGWRESAAPANVGNRSGKDRKDKAMTEPNKEQIEIVYLGGCILHGGKPGAKWITRKLFDECVSTNRGDGGEMDLGMKRDLVSRMSSPFGGKTATRRTVGGVYRTTGEVAENGTLQTAHFGDGNMTFVEKLSHPVIALFEAASWQEQQKVKRLKAERAVKSETFVQRELDGTVRWLKTFPASQRRTIADALVSQLYDALYR